MKPIKIEWFRWKFFFLLDFDGTLWTLDKKGETQYNLFRLSYEMFKHFEGGAISIVLLWFKFTLGYADVNKPRNP
jgi:hypothetical protein